MISSVPYVPPDTMKNVAATSGQSVSFAALFLVVGMTREGSWVGSDKELNFYSRPPKGTRSRRCGRVSSHSQHTRVVPACKKKMHPDEIFSLSLTVPSYYARRSFDRAVSTRHLPIQLRPFSCYRNLPPSGQAVRQRRVFSRDILGSPSSYTAKGVPMASLWQ